MRVAVDVRPVRPDDLPELARLCVVARDENATGAQISVADPDQLARQLGVLLAVPGGHILLAVQDDAVVGFLMARLLDVNVFNDEPRMYIEGLYVAQDARRKGVGHALLTVLADLAATAGATEVYSVPIPGARGVQRFLARMGFAPAGAHRVVATPVLQRRLLGDQPVRKRPARGLEDLIARRRKARTETNSGPVDLRDFRQGLTTQEIPSVAALEPERRPPLDVRA